MLRGRLKGTASIALFLISSHTVAFGQDEEAVLLDPVIVSGGFIEKSWLESGVSAEVISEEDIENRPSQDTVKDILSYTTNVTLPAGTGKSATIRGIDGTGPAENANAFFAGSRSRLGLSIDGRPANYNEIVFGNSALWDVERVELLRGPQSTITGRNAIAGTVTVKTNDPVFEQEAAAQTSFGNYDNKQLSGMVNDVLVEDVVAGRLAFDIRSGRSSVNYQSFEGVDNPGDIESANVRGKLLIEGDNSTIRLTATHNSYVTPNGEIIVRPFEQRNSNFPEQPVHETWTNSLNTEIEVELSDEWIAELDASATDFSFRRKTAPNGSKAGINSTEFSFDPRLRWYGDNDVEALLGAHIYQSRQKETIFLVSDLAFKDDVNTYAAYGEVVLPAYDKVNLTLGSRYEIEEHRRTGGDATGAVASIDLDQSFKTFLPRADLNWQPNDKQSLGFLVSRGYNSGGGGISFGFPSPFPVINYTYEKETAWNYELYGRHKLMDDKLRLSHNLFYSNYSDMQLPFDLTPDNTADELFVIRNADKVTVYGIEFGANYDVRDDIELFGNVGLLKTEVTSYPNSGVEGNELFSAPNFTANAGVNWMYEGILTSFTTRYTDGYFSDINNRPRGKTDGYFVADAKISYDLGNFKFFGEVNNIFDTDEAVAKYPNATSSASDTAVLEQPRSYKVGLKVAF
ncbi:TonB-dependent receptor [Curvivirga sp.]|uniref:TonB-dependent receptor n=1 Tax=Curvivirga sp. TaxID=2856848 RepID=UPI003B5C5F02